MIRLKEGVSLDNVHPQIFFALSIAAPIWARYGSRDLWVVAANEPGHSVGLRGFHRLPDGTCQAVDIRTWTLPTAEAKHRAIDDLATSLGALYDVLFEPQITDDRTGKVIRGEHVHCQYDPERPGTA